MVKFIYWFIENLSRDLVCDWLTQQNKLKTETEARNCIQEQQLQLALSQLETNSPDFYKKWKIRKVEMEPTVEWKETPLP